MPNLSTKLAGIKLKNPTILASGVMGVSASSLKFVEESGAGAVTIKSIGKEERSGHANPTVISWGEGLQNAVGLSNPGIDGSIDKLEESAKRLEIPLFGSMFGSAVDDFKEIAKKMMKTGVSAIEVNLSCPNVHDQFGRMFALDPKMTQELISVVKHTVGKLPVIAKLSADSPDIHLVARAAEEAGADAICAINTVSGMVIDIYQKRPILTNKIGGISGKAIKPIGVRAVWNIYNEVKIPIIGTGGVETGEDALEYIMAGATVVGIGSGIYSRGVDVFKKITLEMENFMKQEGYKNIEEIIGIGHNLR